MLVRGGRADDMLLIIGDERGSGLCKKAFGMVRGQGYTTEELVYLSEVFDHFAWMSSECDQYKQEKALEEEDPR